MTGRSALDRLLRPRTIALVGLSDNNARMLDGLRPTFETDCEVFVVNPRYERVMGRPTAGSLTDLGQPIDCVLCAMGADRSTDLAEEAATLDVGGMVLVANGFAEAGGEGARLQERIRAAAAAGGFAAVGPNGLGFENVPCGIRLTIAVKETHNVGGISVVSQSGAALTGVTMAGNAAGAGFNLLISAGNEAVSDLADFVGYLADDPATRAIGLVFEKIRRPEPFFAAVRRAIAAGKPVVAVKLARTERTQRMAASHTGALTGDAWVYDVALRQLGVSIAYDPEEAADRLTLIDKVPPDRWTPVRGLGVVTRTGGFASLTCDVAGQEGVPLPELDDLLPWIHEWMPAATVPNPLDTAGGGGPHFREIVERYLAAPEVDAFLVPQPMSAEEDHARSLVSDLAAAAETVRKPVVLTNVAGMPPDWAGEFEGGALAFGRGVRQSLRGLATIGSFVRHRAGARPPVEVPERVPRPPFAAIRDGDLAMLPFDATMRLLRDAGLPVAPYALVAPDLDPDSVDVPFPGPYVVKLADVAHRTEHRAVRLDVPRAELRAAIEDLRALASAAGLPAAAAVQPMIPAAGEVLVGARSSELGPVVVFGPGGIFVEALHRIGGRMAPFDLDEARALIDEFRDVRLLHGFRGRPAWDLEQLARILTAAGRLAAAAHEWMASLDLNPVVYSGSGYAVVDGLLVVREEPC